MEIAKIDIPDAAYRRAARTAKAQGVSFEAFTPAAIYRAAPPSVANRTTAIPKGMVATEFLSVIGPTFGRAEAAAWPEDFPKSCGFWTDEARDPWA